MDATSETIRFGSPLAEGPYAFGALVEYLELYNGIQPESPEMPPTGSILLVRKDINPYPEPHLSGGFLVYYLENFTGDSTDDPEIVGTGTPTWFRLADVAGNGVLDGTVGYEPPPFTYPHPPATHDLMLPVDFFDHVNPSGGALVPYYPDINTFVEYSIPAVDDFGNGHPYFPFEWPWPP